MAHPVFEPSGIYHVFNRSHGWEEMFSNDGNYRFFLRQFVKYLSPFVSTLCYCLMPNHFHLLIRIKDDEVIKSELLASEISGDTSIPLNHLLIKKFGDFFNSYTKSYNIQQGRRGSLFMHSFRRKPVLDEIYLSKLIHYIHRNPVKAGLCSFPEDWHYSSYRHLVFPGRDELITLDIQSVIEVYGDLTNFIETHNHAINFELD